MQISRCAVAALVCALHQPLAAQLLPDGFSDTEVLAGLAEPATLVFAPDGRLFVGERITGRLLVAKRGGDDWTLESEPFYVFDIPVNPDGTPARHRSSGLRDIAFDPAFAANGYVYAFFMKNNPRHNRVVRIQASATNPDVAEPGSELLLIDLPFNATGSSGSHNGGGVEFGSDGLLYITTGDGWSGGDPVQSLTTFTGKLLRIHSDGTIPTDNPFYDTATGAYRAIYARGLRNPFSISRNDETGELFVNDAVGTAKANVYLAAPGLNYGHQGGPAPITAPWANAAAAGELVTGGAWYPQEGSFPSEMHGSYFVALWGSNGADDDGAIGRIRSRSDPVAETFATEVHDGDRKPILTRVDPLTGDLFYALTTYETDDGSVHRIRFTDQQTAAPPTFDPPAGHYDDPIAVEIASATSGAAIHYTTDGSEPDEDDPQATAPVDVVESLTLRARAYAPPLPPSPIRAADYQIGPVPNEPPVAIAGADQTAEIGQLVVLNGAASYDPDGDDEQLIEEWRQLAGPPLSFVGDDFVSFIEPVEQGVYDFELEVSDGQDTAFDQTRVTVVACVEDVVEGLAGRWSFDEGSGGFALDSSPGARVGTLEGPAWDTSAPDGSSASLLFDGVDDRVDLGTFDLAGGAVSLAAWMRADDFEHMDGRLISKATGVEEDGHYWMLSTIQQAGEHRLRVRLRTGGETTTLIASSGPLVAGTWHHAAATWDGGTLRLFLDGVPVGSVALIGSIDTAPSVPVAIGDQPQGGRPFDGAIDSVRLYARALTVEEIEVLAGRRSRCELLFGDGFEDGNTAAWSSTSG
ncbi:MAG: hypothetical protein DWQ36_12680 [Acidobacteria bacterium]|nr:MAG: hypothetical protein DWQ30_13020 [Acidobacteriota bacterium]REK07392.1 MAG: hypothetical protein DWQ36_12680 [Acidobacteriota bacterium]